LTDICPIRHNIAVAADLVLNEKTVFEDGSILQVRIWFVPTSVPPTRHRYKYSLFYRRPGERIVGFDNERGKGDHKHVLGVKTQFRFVSIAQLLTEFRTEVERVRGTPI
jgi:hypothetical protein